MSELEPLEEGEENVHGLKGLAISKGDAGVLHGRAITQELLLKALEKQSSSRGMGPAEAARVLAKQTHLHLNSMRISVISNMRNLPRLEVLYLYDNAICSMQEGLGQLRSLTHLYLQNNNISVIDGISGLPNLTKLYLQGNQIPHVSNLHNLPSLEELHLSNQRLEPGQGLTFDLHAMLAVSPTLRVLCASSCSIVDGAVAMLPPLPQLRKLDLSDNELEVVESSEVLLRSAGRLMLLELHGNPFCKSQQQRYRDSVILMSDSIASLDSEEITQQQRSFLLRFQIQKLKNQVQVQEPDEPGAAPRHRDGPASSSSQPGSADPRYGGRRQLGRQLSQGSGRGSNPHPGASESFRAVGSGTRGSRGQPGQTAGREGLQAADASRGESDAFSLPLLEGTRIR